MSLVEPERVALPPKLVRWTVYGLASVGALVVVASGMFPSAPFTALAIAVALAPLALTLWQPDLFVVMSRGRRGGAPQPGLNPVAGLPAAALFFRAVGMDLIDFEPSWIAAGASAAGLAAAAWLRRPVRTPIQLVLYMTLFGLMLGYGAATQGDVNFDASPGAPFRATVMDTHVSSGRSTSYTVELSPWGPVSGWNWQSVPRSTYMAVSAGDQLCVRLHPGWLHERWFTLDLCPSLETPPKTNPL